MRQLQLGYQNLLHRTPADIFRSSFPRIITLGGDHTITLPILRALNSAYGPVSVIHFDSHLDTWYDSFYLFNLFLSFTHMHAHPYTH